MNQETSDLVLGVFIFVVLIPMLYIIGRTIGFIEDVRHAHLLAPLAPAIGGTVNQSPCYIRGSYLGRDVRVYFTPQQSVGSGDSARSFNAFHIEVIDLPGQQNWRIKFYLSGFLGQGPKQLFIEVSDTALGKRLEHSGVLAEVSAVSAPTLDYVTVEYEARRKILTFTDDVSPSRIPSPEQFAAQLELVAHLAKINEQVNSI